MVSPSCELAVEQALGERVLDVPLDGAPQGPGAQVAVEALARQEALDLVIDHEVEALLFEHARRTRTSSRSTICVTCSWVRAWKTITSSTRFEELGAEGLLELLQHRVRFMRS